MIMVSPSLLQEVGADLAVFLNSAPRDFLEDEVHFTIASGSAVFAPAGWYAIFTPLQSKQVDIKQANRKTNCVWPAKVRTEADFATVITVPLFNLLICDEKIAKRCLAYSMTAAKSVPTSLAKAQSYVDYLKMLNQVQAEVF